MRNNIVKKIIAIVLTSVLLLSVVFIAQAYEDIYIDYQGAYDVRDIPWGLKGNTWDNGCGWIAVYNILASKNSDELSKEELINKVTGDLTRIGSPLFFGLLGADPFTMTYYLKSKFETAKISSLLNEGNWTKISNNADGVIVLSYNGGTFLSLHYVAGIKSENKDENGNTTFAFYNTADADPYEKITVNEFTDRLRSDGDIPLAMIYVLNRKDNR